MTLFIRSGLEIKRRVLNVSYVQDCFEYEKRFSTQIMIRLRLSGWKSIEYV